MATAITKYEKSILGYLRINALTDEDYNELTYIFNNSELELPQSVDANEWLHYKADTIIYDYYRNKERKCKQTTKGNDIPSENLKYLNRLKHKCADLYLRISQNEFTFEYKYKKRYKFPYSPDGEDILYDVIFIFEEVLQDLLSINTVESRPHEKLIFCYKYLINGWGSKDILIKLRKTKLDDLMISFVNEYSEESGLPHSVVLFYFYPLEEDIHMLDTSHNKLYKYFTAINLKEFLSSQDKKQYMKGIISKRINLIDKWSERTREKLMDSISK